MKIYSFSIILLILSLIAKTSAVTIGPVKHSIRISSPVPSEENDNDDLLLEMSPTVEPKVEDESSLPSPAPSPTLFRRENRGEEVELSTQTVLLDVTIILDSFPAIICGPQRKTLRNAKLDAQKYNRRYIEAAACLKEVRKDLSIRKRAVRQLRRSLEKARRRIKELKASIKAAIAIGNAKLERRLRKELRKVQNKRGETREAFNKAKADYATEDELERQKSGKEISLNRTLEKVTDILVAQRSKYLRCTKKQVD